MPQLALALAGALFVMIVLQGVPSAWSDEGAERLEYQRSLTTIADLLRRGDEPGAARKLLHARGRMTGAELDVLATRCAEAWRLERRSLPQLPGAVVRSTTAEGGEYMVVATREGHVSRVDVRGRIVWSVRLRDAPCSSVSATRERVLCGFDDGYLVALSARDGRELLDVKLGGAVTAIATRPDMPFGVAVTADGRLHSFSLTDIRRRLSSLSVVEADTRSLAVRGDLVLHLTNGGVARLFRRSDGQALEEVKLPGETMVGVAVCALPRESSVVLFYVSGRISQWRLNPRSLIRSSHCGETVLNGCVSGELIAVRTSGGLYVWRGAAASAAGHLLEGESASAPYLFPSPHGFVLNRGAGRVQLYGLRDEGLDALDAPFPYSPVSVNTSRGAIVDALWLEDDLLVVSGDGHVSSWRLEGAGAASIQLGGSVVARMLPLREPERLVLFCLNGQTAVISVPDHRRLSAVQEQEFAFSSCAPAGGRRLVVAAQDGSVVEWTLRPGQMNPRRHRVFPRGSVSVGCYYEGFLAGGGDGIVYEFSGAEGESPQVAMNFGDSVRSIDVAEDGVLVAVGGARGTVVVADHSPTIAPLWRSEGAGEAVKSVAFSPGGALMLIWRGLGTIAIHRSRDGEHVGQITETHPVRSCAWAPSGDRLLVKCKGCPVRVYTPDGKLAMCATQASHGPAIWHPGGAFLAVAGVGGEIHIVDAQVGRELCRLYGHNALVTALAFGPAGKALYSAAGDGDARAWIVCSPDWDEIEMIARDAD